MATLPEVSIPEAEPEVYDPEAKQNYGKKARVDTDRVFKKTRGRGTNNEEKLSAMRTTKPRPEYKNPMKDVDVSFKEEEKNKVVEKIEEVNDDSTDEDITINQIINTPKGVDPDEDKEEKQPEPEVQLKVEEIKPVKKKRVMSQKQLDALARGRANSLKNRQARASTKKEMKSKEVLKSDDVAGKPHVNQIPPKGEDLPKKSYLTKDDVKDISVKAITEYDMIRKKRKAVKKEKKTQHISDVRTTQAIQRALNPNDMDFYGDCFNISY